MRRAFLWIAVSLGIAGSLYAHDLFLRFSSSFLGPSERVTVPLLNGTFDRSDNTITRDRMVDVSIVGPVAEVVHPAPEQWRDVGKKTLLDFETGPTGTYTIGVSTKPRVIELSGEAFDRYLSHDGVDDVLAARKRLGLLGKKARERYSKHVKAIFQVGEARSPGYRARLDYPIEIVPLQNPYELSSGDQLEVQVRKDGEPLPKQLVYASHSGYHGHDASGRHIEACRTRTDDKGVARIPLGEAGAWYVRLIHMVPLDEPDVDYESLWATLTFAVREREGVSHALILGLVGGGFVLLLVLLIPARRRLRGAREAAA